MNPQLDLYGNIGEIRDLLDTLLKRGKPVSVADLQTLIATVEAKSRPTVQLSAAKVAQQLAPLLLARLPTPDNLAAAGQQVAAQIEAALSAGTAASTRQVVATVQQSTQQLTTAAERLPRSVEVDYIRSWGHVAALTLGPLAMGLLFLWIGGAFSGVAPAKYERAVQVAQAVGAERDYYQQKIQAFKKDMSKGGKELRKQTEQYFPVYIP